MGFLVNFLSRKFLGPKNKKNRRKLLIGILIFVVILVIIISNILRIVTSPMTEIIGGIVNLYTSKNEGEEEGEEDDYLEWVYRPENEEGLQWSQSGTGGLSNNGRVICNCAVASCPNHASGSSSDWSTGKPASQVAGNTNEEKIWNYFAGRGYTDIAIAGIIGNMHTESSTFNPWQQFDNRTHPYEELSTLKQATGGVQPAIGIIQWLFYRKDVARILGAVYPESKQYWGKTNIPGDVTNQLLMYELMLLDEGFPEYADKQEELGIEYPRVFSSYISAVTKNEMNNATDVGGANGSTATFHRDVEGSEDSGPKIIDVNYGSGGRAWYAKQVYDKYGNGGLTNSSTVPSVTTTVDPPIGIPTEYCTSCQCVTGTSGTGGKTWEGHTIENIDTGEVYAHVKGEDSALGKIITVHDIVTGKSFNAKVYYFSETYHLDWEPATPADETLIQTTFDYDWAERGAIMEYNGRYFVGAFHTRPHAEGAWGGGWPGSNPPVADSPYAAGDWETEAGVGHACLHFLNSYSNANSGPAPGMQSKIKEVWDALQSSGPAPGSVTNTPGIPQSGVWANSNLMMEAINEIENERKRNVCLTFAGYVGQPSESTQRNSFVKNANNAQVWSQADSIYEPWGQLTSTGVARVDSEQDWNSNDLYSDGCTIYSTASALSSMIGRTINPPELLIIAHINGVGFSGGLLTDVSVRKLIEIVLDANGMSGKYTLTSGEITEDAVVKALNSGGRVVFRYNDWGHFSTLRYTEKDANGNNVFYRADSASEGYGTHLNNTPFSWEDAFTDTSRSHGDGGSRRLVAVITLSS